MSRPLPPLNALRAFEAAARLGSLSRAADELHVTHGAISRHVRTLEEALGAALFERDGRGLALTARGQRLRDAAGDAFATLQAAWSTLQRSSGAPAALVLGCAGSVLARWAIPRLERLSDELPDLTLHFSAREGFDATLSGLDAALLLGEAPWPSAWQVHALAPERIGPVLSPRQARLATLQDAAPSALREAPRLHTRSRPQAWPRWFAAHGLAVAEANRGTGFEHLTYLLEAAVAGLGVAIAPQELVQNDLEQGRLVAPWGFSETGGQWALCTRRGSDDARIPALADWLRRELLPGP